MKGKRFTIMNASSIRGSSIFLVLNLVATTIFPTNSKTIIKRKASWQIMTRGKKFGLFVM